jgi:putative flippase GtrA
MKNVFKFLLSGGGAAVVYLAALYAMTEWLQIWYLTSSIVAYVLSFLINFVLQKWWVFGGTQNIRTHHQLAMFVALNLFNIALNAVLLATLVEYFQVWYMLAQLAVIGVISISNFYLYRRFIFVSQDKTTI